MTETVTIPPNSEMIVGRYFNNPDKDILPKCALLEGSDKLLENKHVLVARSLVNLRADIIPVRVLNPHDQPTHIFKETVLGFCEIVEQVPTDVQSCSKVNQMNTNTETSSISQHFQTLLAECQPLLSVKQQQEVQSVVIDYRDIFAKSKSKSNTPPIKQQPRRVPLGKQKVVREEVGG